MRAMQQQDATAAVKVETVKLQDAARSLGLPPEEFRPVLAAHGIPVLRPTPRRERILKEHFELLCVLIAGPAVREDERAGI